MTVRDFAEKLNMESLTGDEGLEKEISGMYACDLLSWVMGHGGKGNGWITVHTHLNIVAVALLAEISCIIIPEGINVEEVTIKRAQQEGVVILGSKDSTYRICCRAYELGI